MTSFNCLEIRASRSAMRLLIITSVSFDTVICPVITSCTRSFSQSFPAVRSSAVWPILPSTRIRSSRLTLSTVLSAAGWDSVIGLVSPGILALLPLARANAGFRAGLAQQLLVLNYFLQKALQLFIANETAAQVSQAIAQFEQLAERCHLLGYLRRLKIVHTFKAQLDIQLCIVLIQAIGYLEGEPRADFLHDIVYVVPVDCSELAFRNRGKRVVGHTRQVRQHTNNKRQIPFFDGITDLHIVSDVHPGRANPADLLLQTFFRHCSAFLRRGWH